MSKCYINLSGGIGNQLFQLATAYSYAKRTNKELLINTQNWSASQGSNPNIYKDNIFQKFVFKDYLDENIKIISEKEEFKFDELPNHDGDVILNGYFQHKKYFEANISEFISMLTLPEVDKYFIDDESVACHIRRGDYLHYNHIYGVCDTNYFRTNFQKFQNNKINVFTDSVDYVLDEFKDDDFRVIVTKKDILDLILMSHHKHLICSNSSFSWWASRIGSAKETIIVPSVWIKDKDCSGLYTDNMTIYRI